MNVNVNDLIELGMGSMIAIGVIGGILYLASLA